MSTITTTARNVDLAAIKAVLDDQRARRLDLVCGSEAITAKGGLLTVNDAIVSDEGVTQVQGAFRPTDVCQEGLGYRLGVPSAWLRNMAENRVDLYDATINGLIHGSTATGGKAPDGTPYPAHTGKHLLRLLQGDPGEPGVARALLSHKYGIMDNLDVLVAVLQGIRESGLSVHVGACDLSDRRMYVRLECPSVAALAPRFMANYRSPFDRPGGPERAGGSRDGTSASDWAERSAIAANALHVATDAPNVGDIVWAGIVISNSDVGQGSRYMAPQVRVLACRNGQTITKDANRRVHLGAAQEDGVVEWSTDTRQKELALIQAQAKDSVQAWLSTGYLADTIAEIERQAGVPLTRAPETVRTVVTAAGFTKAQAEDVFGFFQAGGTYTAAGVAHAATAYAQTVTSPEVAFDLEGKALDMMAHAARLG